MKQNIKEILELNDNIEVELSGWIKNIRGNKNIIFISIYDGSCFEKLQLVVKNDLSNFEEVSKLQISSAINVSGELKLTENRKQSHEILVKNFNIVARSNSDFPIQKKIHSKEFLRSIPHLRLKSDYFYAMFKVRSFLFQKIHEFFSTNQFHYVSSPLITSNDAEGAGESFLLDSNKNGDFFGKNALLSVSGQLTAECFAQVYQKTYVFGPAFRAEKSNTTKHLAEFWMLEPEIAFCDLKQIMKNSMQLLTFLSTETLKHCKDEILFFSENSELELEKRLKMLEAGNVKELTYDQAIEILVKQKNKFKNSDIHWGMDLQTEHERYLCEQYTKCPTFITHYPEEIKSFYMRQTRANPKTVEAFDLLVPGIGELIGGSAREDDINILKSKINKFNIDENSLHWYLELRKYGYAPSAGYGLGFERLLMFFTGAENIKDTIPIPRSYGSLIL